MRGNIIKRGSTYTVILHLGRDPVTGKYKQKWFGGYKTKKEAEKAMIELISKLENGEVIEHVKQTLAEYLAYWLEYSAKNKLSPKSFIRYQQIINTYINPVIGQKLLSKVTPLDLQALYNKALQSKDEGGFGLSPASALYIHRVLSSALKQAVKWQLINKNPTEAVDPPKAKRGEMNIITEKEANLILEEVKDTPAFIPFLLAIMTGMRRGEICGLKWQDVDFKKGLIHVKRTLQNINNELIERPTKTEKSSRSIAISQGLIDVLKKQKAIQSQQKLILGPAYKDQDYICTWEDGTPINPDYLTKKFHKVAKKLDLTVRFHDLRHAHATMLLKEGVHPKVVSERLGHSEIRITLDTYSHVLPDMQKEASEKISKLIKLPK